jgi:hypothetical protein
VVRRVLLASNERPRLVDRRCSTVVFISPPMRRHHGLAAAALAAAWWASVSLASGPAAFIHTASAVAESSGETCSAPADLGCFVDPYSSPVGVIRVLQHVVSTGDANLTRENCIARCCTAGFGVGSLAGVRGGDECYCDNALGPYSIPQDTGACNMTCSGNHTEDCGGEQRIAVLGISACPGTRSSALVQPQWVVDGGATSSGGGLQLCGAGCTACPAQDTCCVGQEPDPYRVPGGYGCAPPNSANTSGCAGGGVFPGGCCCAPGPSIISASLPNVLVIGDSISAGYIVPLQQNLSGVANVQHGPDNAGGGNADGVGYGALCIDYFLRTPMHQLPHWDVVTFNFGLHDLGDTNESYSAGLSHIADAILNATTTTTTVNNDDDGSDTNSTANPGAQQKGAQHVIYFQTTSPDGSGASGPGEQRVLEMNALAATIMAARNIPVVDLYQTMTDCGDTCKDCQPHCSPAGYQYLVDHAITPAVRAALKLDGGHRTPQGGVRAL